MRREVSRERKVRQAVCVCRCEAWQVLWFQVLCMDEVLFPALNMPMEDLSGGRETVRLPPASAMPA